MNKYIIFLILLPLSLLTACENDTLAPGEDPVTKTGTNCASQTTSGVTWSYCMHRYSEASDDVLFYFHGLGGSEKSWQDGALEQAILQNWKNQGKAPLVISISFGDTWFLAEKNSSSVSGLYEFFLSAVLPALQKKLSNLNVDQTYLMGVSMGGFNAAQLYLKKPSLFSRVALLCPAMSTVSPHASKSDIQDYIDQTGADPELVSQSLALAKAFFPTQSDWEKHSPNILAGKVLNSTFPPAYVANGAADPYGFYAGNLQFVTKAQDKLAPMTSNFYLFKGHCDISAVAAATALIPE